MGRRSGPHLEPAPLGAALLHRLGGRGWITSDLAALIDRRPETRDRTRAIDRHKIQTLLTDRDTPLRDKTLRRLLYESAARADESSR